MDEVQVNDKEELQTLGVYCTPYKHDAPNATFDTIDSTNDEKAPSNLVSGTTENDDVLVDVRMENADSGEATAIVAISMPGDHIDNTPLNKTFPESAKEAEGGDTCKDSSFVKERCDSDTANSSNPESSERLNGLPPHIQESASVDEPLVPNVYDIVKRRRDVQAAKIDIERECSSCEKASIVKRTSQILDAESPVHKSPRTWGGDTYNDKPTTCGDGYIVIPDSCVVLADMAEYLAGRRRIRCRQWMRRFEKCDRACRQRHLDLLWRNANTSDGSRSSSGTGNGYTTGVDETKDTGDVLDDSCKSAGRKRKQEFTVREPFPKVVANATEKGKPKPKKLRRYLCDSIYRKKCKTIDDRPVDRPKPRLVEPGVWVIPRTRKSINTPEPERVPECLGDSHSTRSNGLAEDELAFRSSAENVTQAQETLMSSASNDDSSTSTMGRIDRLLASLRGPVSHEVSQTALTKENPIKEVVVSEAKTVIAKEKRQMYNINNNVLSLAVKVNESPLYKFDIDDDDDDAIVLKALRLKKLVSVNLVEKLDHDLSHLPIKQGPYDLTREWHVPKGKSAFYNILFQPLHLMDFIIKEEKIRQRMMGNVSYQGMISLKETLINQQRKTRKFIFYQFMHLTKEAALSVSINLFTFDKLFLTFVKKESKLREQIQTELNKAGKDSDLACELLAELRRAEDKTKQVVIDRFHVRQKTLVKAFLRKCDWPPRFRSTEMSSVQTKDVGINTMVTAQGATTFITSEKERNEGTTEPIGKQFTEIASLKKKPPKLLPKQNTTPEEKEATLVTTQKSCAESSSNTPESSESIDYLKLPDGKLVPIVENLDMTECSVINPGVLLQADQPTIQVRTTTASNPQNRGEKTRAKQSKKTSNVTPIQDQTQTIVTTSTSTKTQQTEVKVSTLNSSSVQAQKPTPSITPIQAEQPTMLLGLSSIYTPISTQVSNSASASAQQPIILHASSNQALQPRETQCSNFVKAKLSEKYSHFMTDEPPSNATRYLQLSDGKLVPIVSSPQAPSTPVASETSTTTTSTLSSVFVNPVLSSVTAGAAPTSVQSQALFCAQNQTVQSPIIIKQEGHQHSVIKDGIIFPVVNSNNSSTMHVLQYLPSNLQSSAYIPSLAADTPSIAQNPTFVMQMTPNTTDFAALQQTLPLQQFMSVQQMGPLQQIVPAPQTVTVPLQQTLGFQAVPSVNGQQIILPPTQTIIYQQGNQGLATQFMPILQPTIYPNVVETDSNTPVVLQSVPTQLPSGNLTLVSVPATNSQTEPISYEQKETAISGNLSADDATQNQSKQIVPNPDPTSKSKGFKLSKDGKIPSLLKGRRTFGNNSPDRSQLHPKYVENGAKHPSDEKASNILRIGNNDIHDSKEKKSKQKRKPENVMRVDPDEIDDIVRKSNGSKKRRARPASPELDYSMFMIRRGPYPRVVYSTVEERGLRIPDIMLPDQEGSTLMKMLSTDQESDDGFSETVIKQEPFEIVYE